MRCFEGRVEKRERESAKDDERGRKNANLHTIYLLCRYISSVRKLWMIVLIIGFLSIEIKCRWEGVAIW